MKKGFILEGILAILVILLMVIGNMPFYNTLNEQQEDIKHDTSRWAIIVDKEGSRIAIEAANKSIWDEMVANYKEYEDSDFSEMTIFGGIVRYNNSWKFRIDPKEVTYHYTLIKGPTHRIKQLSENLEYYLEYTGYIAIYLESIEFHYTKNIGTIPLIINMTEIGIAILLFSLYIYFRKEITDYDAINDVLRVAKTIPQEDSFTLIKQKTGLRQKRIEQIIKKIDQKEESMQKITNEQIKSKELIHLKNIKRIDEQLKEITLLTSGQITPERFSTLLTINKKLMDAQKYCKENVNKELQHQIEMQLEIVTELLDYIKLEDLNCYI